MKILFYIAAFCLLSQALGLDRKLDETLLVDRNGLTVIQGANPVSFKCGTEWAVAFSNNGQTAVLSTINGHWTLTGLTPAVAVAAVGEGTTLVSGIAGSVGVAADNLADVTSRTIALASTLAQNIGSPSFDAALVAAAATANNLLDENGIQASDFNDDILTAISLLGPSGGVIDASDTTVQDVHDNASKTIGTIMNALASSGAMAPIPSVAAASAAAAAGGALPAGAGAAAAAAAGGDAAALAAAAAAGGNAAALAAMAAAAGGK